MEKKGRLIINVYSAKERSVDDLAWCAFCQDVKPLFWKDGRLFCYEMKFYPKRSWLVVIDSCVAIMPTYNKSIRVEGSANIPSVVLPVVKASAVAEKILEQTLNLLTKPSHRKSSS
ncbi:MAG: hypothetical protein AOA66_0081 [Candidatus Bathyarchaeota archaeon BA2]|nr:MAG: hypothetical protein AOA66_0081 [Candidatus Bathyarchaeota archaeon BA2]